uniref:Uncharacterized protein n=1 Tax=Polysiphonia infestans TaxID=2006978 RepID=A0A1Z1MEW6_9FLOR|nr:hypothetical protein [Polysiphonia infestans]ARW64311.1 hypothetical protein [Polysiphonia infestans]
MQTLNFLKFVRVIYYIDCFILFSLELRNNILLINFESTN